MSFNYAPTNDCLTLISPGTSFEDFPKLFLCNEEL